MEWRTIPGFPDYEVSEFGDVRRSGRGKSNACIVGKVLRPGNCGSRSDYLGFMLYRNGKPRRMTAHRAVALAFLGPPPTDVHQVAHGDGDCRNNHYRNLRWATPSENQSDCLRHGTRPRGERAGPYKFTAEEVSEIRSLRRRGFYQAEIAKIFRTSQSHVGRIVRRQLWRHVP